MGEIIYKKGSDFVILAIDPGNTELAYCIIEKETYKPIEFGKIDNNELLEKISNFKGIECIVVEKVASYGMPVGQTVFDTCEWYGRFIQKYADFNDNFKVEYIYRKEEKINLCSSLKAKDSNIRQALIDRFGVVGTKKNPGWFYEFKSDIWSAYATGVTYLDKVKNDI